MCWNMSHSASFVQFTTYQNAVDWLDWKHCAISRVWRGNHAEIYFHMQERLLRDIEGPLLLLTLVVGKKELPTTNSGVSSSKQKALLKQENELISLTFCCNL